jgi:hypothetical protein
MRFWAERRKRPWLAIETGIVLLLSGLAVVSPARAQVGAVGGANAPSVQPPPVNSGRADVFANPGRTDDALIAGGWLIYPSAFVGGVYDSNPNQSSHGQSSGGARLTPSLLAETVGDLTKTTIYGVADGRIYFGSHATDTVDVSSGIVETYQPLPDLVFTGQGDYTRQRDLFATLGTTHSVQLLNTTGIGLSPVSNPQAYNQLSAAAAVQKNFASAFAIVSGSVVGQIYDQNAPGASADNVTYTGGLKGGVWITPALYAFFDGKGDSRNLSVSGLSSSGYRIAGGLGTDQIGLVRGELYGGYQAEDYSSSTIGRISNPIFGARGYYYPLPELTVNLSVDEQLGASLLTGSPVFPLGSATRLTTVLATADYNIGQQWSASGRAGYVHTNYVNTARRDDAWTVGGTVTYQLLRNVGLTGDYQHVQLSSNAVLQSFSRDIFTLGLSLKY